MSASKKHMFVYSGYSTHGQQIHGHIRAENQWARHKLRKQGLQIHSIKKSLQYPFSRHQTIVPSDITLFTQQLALLLKVGIPLSKCFVILSASSNKSIMKMLLGELIDDIATGDSFAKALRKHPQQFDGLYCNMVESGELSGKLATVLGRISAYQERTQRLKKNLIKAMTYPFIVVVVAIVVTGILLAKVIPEFAITFSEFGAELPSFTLFVLTLSELFRQFWLSCLAVISVCIGFFITAQKKSKKFSNTIDRLILKLPIIGTMVRNAILVRFSRTLAITFNAGIPILDALQSAANTAGNSVYEQGILNLRQDLIHGVSLYRAISNQSVFPLALKQMIIVGEESGTLGTILDRASGFYERDLQLSLDSLMQVTEPLIMLILGIVVGGILLAMYLPIFQIGTII